MNWLKNLSRKEVFSFAVLLVLGVAFFFLYNSYKSEPVYEMTGEIVEAGEGYIKVKGLVGRSNKTVEFSLDDNTIINMSALVITPEQLQVRGTFVPKTIKGKGTASDLSVGKVVVARSADNLLSGEKTRATRIDSSRLELPRKSLP